MFVFIITSKALVNSDDGLYSEQIISDFDIRQFIIKWVRIKADKLFPIREILSIELQKPLS